MQRIIDKIKAEIKNRPDLKSEMMEFYYLAKEEVEQGESLENEVELAINSINELVGG